VKRTPSDYPTWGGAAKEKRTRYPGKKKRNVGPQSAKNKKRGVNSSISRENLEVAVDHPNGKKGKKKGYAPGRSEKSLVPLCRKRTKKNVSNEE